MTPLVSVIIPTFNRPHYLPRAVDSALAGMPPDEVEVIVVPNGPDESWKESLLPYRDNPSVRVIPIAEANANIARNTGLAASRGEFVRFLDDDDYLIPEGAVRQYEVVQESNIDIVCGAIDAINPRGEIVRTFRLPPSDDFCEAIASPEGFYLPHAYVYRSKCIVGMKWNPTVRNRQDFYWLVDICKVKEFDWQRIDEIVGVWKLHWGNRITLAHSNHVFHRKAAQALVGLFNDLKRQNRLTESRRMSIAQGLWTCVHAAFPLNPQYWSRVARVAQRIDPQSRPIQAVYNWPIARSIDPLTMQWLLWPKRRFYHLRRGWLLKRQSDRFW